MRLDVDKVTLERGAHDRPSKGLCVMEAVAYIAREQHSDHPECVSPVIARFLRSWNDALSDGDRQKLKPLISVVMDTRSTPEDEERRAWLALDWLVRVHTPAWLRLAGLTRQAEQLEGLSELRPDTCPKIMPALKAVRADAVAAWDAAWDAAGAAARDAARAAAADAAWDADADAAWAAATAAATAAAADAAWDAARDAATDAAADAATAAAWDAAGAAARDAARAAARAAAADAARDALRPTVEELQTSALDLVERMAWLKDDE